MNSLCTQFGLSQCIQEPSHFIENASSILDLVLVTNKNSVLVTGVGEPCLDSHVRYHCPAFAVLNFLKPRHKSIRRTIWKYDEGNYDDFRIELNNFDWDTLACDDIDMYVNNFTNTLSQIASSFIPNKCVTIKPYEPPWLTKEIKNKIRQRKRLYRKARKTDSLYHWNKFKKLRNEIVCLIRQRKDEHFQNLTSKLKTGSLSSCDWWKIIKHGLIMDSSKMSNSSIPPLFYGNNDKLISDEIEKASIKYFFRKSVKYR